MLIDVTLKITPKMVTDAQGNEKKALVGHLGTHFDVMDKDFPLDYTKRIGICYDVSDIPADIEISDQSVDLSLVKKEMFVCFYSGYMRKEGYGSKAYFVKHPQLSMDLIDQLLAKGVSLIGVDFAGVRRGNEHTPTDQRCAEKGTFIIENMDHLADLPKEKAFVIHTYPMNYEGMTGLPCRIVAEV